MLEMEALTVRYGAVRALEDVSLQVPDASVTAVLGANGAGKTTLLRTVSGLVRPASGSVRHDGRDITRLPVEEMVRDGIAHVPEGRGVVQELTVEENLRLGALWRRDRPDRRRALTEMYELFPPLAQRRRRSAFTLSGGERQMLAIARALMSRPRVLLLDEPSLGLAPLITAKIMAVMRDLAATSKLTVLIAEQNARSALSISHQAVVLNLGTVVMQGDPSQLARDEDLRHHYLGF